MPLAKAVLDQESKFPANDLLLQEQSNHLPALSVAVMDQTVEA